MEATTMTGEIQNDKEAVKQAINTIINSFSKHPHLYQNGKSKFSKNRDSFWIEYLEPNMAENLCSRHIGNLTKLEKEKWSKYQFIANVSCVSLWRNTWDPWNKQILYNFHEICMVVYSTTFVLQKFLNFFLNIWTNSWDLDQKWVEKNFVW